MILIQPDCAWCRAWPCVCALVRSECVCGDVLVARDDLDSKRVAAMNHVRSVKHRRWRRHG
jgi:hypothetical protein